MRRPTMSPNGRRTAAPSAPEPRNALARVRELIRAEVDRANPVEESRRALELIVETSLRYEETPEGLKVAVLDDEGGQRTGRTGHDAEGAIRDLVAELRRKHPRLFAPPAAAPQTE